MLGSTPEDDDDILDGLDDRLQRPRPYCIESNHASTSCERDRYPKAQSAARNCLALSSHRRRTQRHLVRLAWRRRPQPAASELFGGEEQQPTLQIEHAEQQQQQQQLEEPVAERQRRLRASGAGGMLIGAAAPG